VTLRQIAKMARSRRQPPVVVARRVIVGTRHSGAKPAFGQRRFEVAREGERQMFFQPIAVGRSAVDAAMAGVDDDVVTEFYRRSDVSRLGRRRNERKQQSGCCRHVILGRGFRHARVHSENTPCFPNLPALSALLFDFGSSD